MVAVQSEEKINALTLYINLKPKDEQTISQKAFELQIRPQLRQIPVKLRACCPCRQRTALSSALQRYRTF